MVEISFYILTILTIFIVFVLLKDAPNTKVLRYRYLLMIILWTVYLVIISKTGVLDNFGLPPRLPLLIVLPAVLIILVVTTRKGFEPVLQTTPLYLPVFLQSFRILVELLIYATFLEGIFPQRATFEGLNFDIVVGISSIFIGVGVLKGLVNIKGLMVWNISSLCILSLTVYSFISAYFFTDFAVAGAGRKLVEFPYLLLPGVLLPMAVFLHVFSIRQIMFHVKSKLG